ncbi:Ribosomal RNA large subunit methyltransferase J [compost metagenome]
MAGERRIAVHQGDGWLMPRAFLPAAEKRAVVLIDPPFEQGDELERCVTALNEAIGRMRQTVVAIWYPIKDERQLKRFYQSLQKSDAPKLLRAELLIHPADSADRLNGSGLAIANPPWPLEDELRSLLPWLAENLAHSEGSWRLDWLVEEAASGKR